MLPGFTGVVETNELAPIRGRTSVFDGQGVELAGSLKIAAFQTILNSLAIDSHSAGKRRETVLGALVALAAEEQIVTDRPDFVESSRTVAVSVPAQWIRPNGHRP